MHKTTHILWDWNGTLLADVDAAITAINRMLHTRSLPLIDITTYRDAFDFPVRDYYERIGFALENEDWDAVAREFHHHYDDAVQDAVLRDGIEAILPTLIQCGVGMSVLSASQLDRLESMLNTYRIRHFFQHVAGLDNLYATSKIDVGSQLMSTLDGDPSSVLLVGDTRHDVEVAEALGCRCVLMTNGHQSRDRISAHGVPVIDSPEDILPLLTPPPPQNISKMYRAQ